MKLTKREKNLLLIAVVIIGGLLYYRFVFAVESKKIKNLQNEYRNKLDLAQEVNNKQKTLSDINLQIEQVEKELDEKKSRIASPLRVPDILEELNMAALNNNVLIDNIEFSGNSAAIKGQYKPAGKTSVKAPVAADSSGRQPEGQDNGVYKLLTLTIDLVFTGNNSDCINLIKFYEQNSRFFVVNELELRESESGCTGTLRLQTFTISLGSSDFLYEEGKVNGRTNPFSDSSAP